MSPGAANWREEGSGQEGEAGCSHVKRLTKKLLVLPALEVLRVSRYGRRS